MRVRRYGVKVTFTYKCAHCHRVFQLKNEPDNEDTNACLVLGGIAFGICYSQLEELCSNEHQDWYKLRVS